ncbi:LysR family transcriptional regulator [Croceicoccus mobilis]|uniref:LysR family transcriptional regulator n=1 Tax=Croceicoccus mobilis TaxID=1703339 RepID=A0A917DVW9_9SPHN|nr:LysR family transcriptional regulator [Croceicoccus mobilis]GGD72397.1 LysR family transcriptional regulator [Croceicoccus mobilis]
MSETGLNYLLAALNAGSMRAAADKLNVAASSISRQIAQLEQVYGMPLIEKARRGVQLTEAGRIVIDHYRDELANREALSARLEELRSVRSGRVVIAAGEGFLGDSFMELIQRFNDGNPDIRVEIQIGSSVDVTHMIVDDEAHLGLVFNTAPDPKVRVRASIAQPLMAIMRPDHPLASLSSVSIAELAQHQLCLAPRNFRLAQILAAAEQQAGHFLEPSIMTNSIYVMREAVRSGTAISILPRVTVWSELQRGEFISIPVANSAMETTTLSLILRAGRQLEGAPVRMLTQLEAQMRQWGKTATQG